MTDRKGSPNIGVGPTPDLTLRVSVATLTRVVFTGPENGQPELALEHKATVMPGQDRVVVRAQPFGGAVRILDLQALQAVAGAFHFDSERARQEQDFRIVIRPATWRTVRDFCLREFAREEETALEADPTRELVEEFKDAMDVDLEPSQFRVSPCRTVLEKEPAPTHNVHAADQLTVRIYRVFEVRIVDMALCRAMLASAQAGSAAILRRLAQEDVLRGGRGRANGMLVVPLQRLRQAYGKLSPQARGEPLSFGDTILGGNVAVLLEGLAVAKYREA